jgi:hypothetical protein
MSVSDKLLKNVVHVKLFGMGAVNRSEIRDLKSYAGFLEKKGVLVDWWKEGSNSICFEIDSTKLKREPLIG